MAGEFWIQLFGSCVQEQEPPPRYSHSDNTPQIYIAQKKKKTWMLMMLEVELQTKVLEDYVKFYNHKDLVESSY